MFSVTGRLVNVFNGNVRKETIFVEDGRIQAVGDFNIQVDRSFDYSNYYITPGFIDAHIHVESSMLTPIEFSRIAVTHGTTCLILEPHEIANVCGVKGIEFMLSGDAPLKLFFTAPSCVPATDMETSGYRVNVREVRRLLRHNRCLGLGEIMNFPGVITGDPTVLKKIEAAKQLSKVCDGHAPGLTGLDLCRYAAAGIQSDHECTMLDEAAEKLKLGMQIMIREGSAAKNLGALVRLVDKGLEDRCMLVSDDVHASELIGEGHLDRILKKAVALDLNPVQAVRMVTFNPARYFGLQGLGAIAPGWSADMVVVKDLKDFQVEAVFVDGRLIVEGGRLTYEVKPAPVPSEVLSTVRFRVLLVNDLKVRGERRVNVRVIRVVPGEIVTESDKALLEAKDGFLIPDVEHDVLPLIVVERHRMSGNLGRGFVSGFGLKSGALASTVAHDSHNVVCVGAHYDDMLAAVRELKMVGGGLVAVNEGKVIAKVELPIAGLMSDRPAEYVREGLEKLHSAARGLGCRLPSPFMTLSFLSLPVIPKLKLTDRGLVDVRGFKLVEMFI